MSNLPQELEKDYAEDEVGARHGDVTGAWRIGRNSVILVVAVFVVIAAVYMWGSP
jgi:hypothetical protein